MVISMGGQANSLLAGVVEEHPGDRSWRREWDGTCLRTDAAPAGRWIQHAARAARCSLWELRIRVRALTCCRCPALPCAGLSWPTCARPDLALAGPGPRRPLPAARRPPPTARQRAARMLRAQRAEPSPGVPAITAHTALYQPSPAHLPLCERSAPDLYSPEHSTWHPCGGKYRAGAVQPRKAGAVGHHARSRRSLHTRPLADDSQRSAARGKAAPLLGQKMACITNAVGPGQITPYPIPSSGHSPPPRLQPPVSASVERCMCTFRVRAAATSQCSPSVLALCLLPSPSTSACPPPCRRPALTAAAATSSPPAAARALALVRPASHSSSAELPPAHRMRWDPGLQLQMLLSETDGIIEASHAAVALDAGLLPGEQAAPNQPSTDAAPLRSNISEPHGWTPPRSRSGGTLSNLGLRSARAPRLPSAPGAADRE
ncbi:hypothetical protein B0J12DRAFT_751954 [Macrophomina phaseolina]|uniref:Uncharacterized protein n=1 Tax=Macrophomina phaseolina TaxID=35725 RepID=A0ABQ8GDD0_9PEZI|nr:hypothetical protein B0J12DRAFT_751954 [Macrophomina phaseolina]